MSRAASTRTHPARLIIGAASAVLLMASSPLLLASTYRWVDANGVVHYSDRPQPGADKVQLPPAQTYSSGRPAPSTAPAPSEPAAAAAASAALQEALSAGECTITSPQDEQTYNNTYSLTISAKGPVGGEVRLMLDGGVVQKGPAAEFLVNPIDRGMHRAIVLFMSPGGGELCRTKSVTFYVRKPTIIRSPQVRPRPKP